MLSRDPLEAPAGQQKPQQQATCDAVAHQGWDRQAWPSCRTRRPAAGGVRATWPRQDCSGQAASACRGRG